MLLNLFACISFVHILMIYENKEKIQILYKNRKIESQSSSGKQVFIEKNLYILNLIKYKVFNYTNVFFN